MRDVYACAFELGATGEGFTRARAAALDWAMNHVLGVTLEVDASGGRWEASPDFAEWSTLTAPDASDELWSMTVFHRDRSDDSLGWRTTVQLAKEGEKVRFSLRLAIEPLMMVVAPAHYDVGRPRLVGTMSDEFSASMDGRLLRRTATEIAVDDIGDLVDLLFAPERRLPVLVVTPAPEIGRPLINDQHLADSLVGLAHVFTLRTVPATYELTQRVGRMLSVFNGAVRIYWPGLTDDSDPYEHRIWFRDRINQMEVSGRPLRLVLMRLLSGLSVLRIPVDPLVPRLRRANEAARAREMEDLRERLQNAPEAFTDELWADYAALDDANNEKANTIERLEADLAAMQQAFATLTKEYGASSAPDVTDEAEEPQSVREVMEAIASEYSDVIVVLPEAFESAQESRFRGVRRLHEEMRVVGDIARRWRAGPLGQSFADAFADAGVDYGSDVSAVTVGRNPSEYERRYDGKKIILGPHIKLGRGTSAANLIRVYWWVDEDGKRFVIGHAGRHLEDGTT